MPPRLTTEKWIERVEEKYPNQFKFKKTIYDGPHSPVIITCKHHGDIKMEYSQSVLYAKRNPCRYCLGFLPEFDGTQKWLRRWTKYNRKKGGLYNKATKQKMGFVKQDGYVHISFDGKAYPEHRLVYKYLMNKYPSVIDHKNKQRDDNRIENLRPATNRLNMMNKGDNKIKATTNCIYQAEIKYEGISHYLGSFETEKEAKQAKKKFRKECYAKEKQKVKWIDSDMV